MPDNTGKYSVIAVKILRQGFESCKKLKKLSRSEFPKVFLRTYRCCMKKIQMASLFCQSLHEKKLNIFLIGRISQINYTNIHYDSLTDRNSLDFFLFMWPKNIYFSFL